MSRIDLSVNIAGVEFKNPLIVASGPPTLSSEHILRCIRAGAAGAVTKTITYDITQQVQPKPRMFVVNPEDALRNKFYSLYSIDLMSEYKPELWLKQISEVKKEARAYGGVIIASIAGRTFEEWEKLAKLVEEAIFAPPVRNYRARLKEALVMMGVLKTSYVRPPLQPVSEEEKVAIRKALKDLRLL